MQVLTVPVYGNIDAEGLGCLDYVEMQWRMLQQDENDFVIATGRQEIMEIYRIINGTDGGIKWENLLMK